MISKERVESLAARQGVDKEAIRSFFSSMVPEISSLEVELSRLKELAEDYPQYAHKTIAAIQTGIFEHFATEA